MTWAGILSWHGLLTCFCTIYCVRSTYVFSVHGNWLGCDLSWFWDFAERQPPLSTRTLVHEDEERREGMYMPSRCFTCLEPLEGKTVRHLSWNVFKQGRPISLHRNMVMAEGWGLCCLQSFIKSVTWTSHCCLGCNIEGQHLCFSSTH